MPAGLSETAAYLVGLQLFSKLLTFALNQLLLRYTRPEQFGVASVQLELLSSTILFLSREAIRSTLCRVDLLAVNAGSNNHDGEGENEHAKPLPLKYGSVSASNGGKEKEKEKQANRMQQFINFTWLPLLIGLPLTALSVILWNRQSSGAGYKVLLMYGVGALMELSIEPFYALSVSLSLPRCRVLTEAPAMLVKCLTLAALLIVQDRSSKSFVYQQPRQLEHHHIGGGGDDDDALWAFGWAQLAYACALLGGYLWQSGTITRAAQIKNLRQLLPSSSSSSLSLSLLFSRLRLLFKSSSSAVTEKRKRQNQPIFDSAQVRTAQSFMGQTVVKFLLTEGDKFVLTALSSDYDQGVYALVNNYGSLIVRILFLPVEESARQYFGRLQQLLLLSSTTATTTSQTKNESADDNPDTHCAGSTESLHRQTGLMLATLIRFHLYSGLLFIAFASQFTVPLLHLLAGTRWSQQTSAGEMLSLYCWLIPLLGLNGVLEGFAQAVGDSSTIQRMTGWMTVFSAVYYALGAYLIWYGGWGTAGLLVANGVNMLLRIGWSADYIRRYYRVSGRDLSAITPSFAPHWVVWLTAGASALLLQLIDGGTMLLVKFTIGVTLGLVYLIVIYLFDGPIIRETIKQLGNSNNNDNNNGSSDNNNNNMKNNNNNNNNNNDIEKVSKKRD